MAAACVDVESKLVSFSTARLRLAAKNAPVTADVLIGLTPELGFSIRESALGDGIIALTFESDALDHELGHSLVRLGDEYTEFDSCCTDGGGNQRPLAVVVGDSGLSGAVNLTTDPAGGPFDGLARPIEGGGRCARCLFHPEGPCEMEGSNGSFCPVCVDGVRHRSEGLLVPVDPRALLSPGHVRSAFGERGQPGGCLE